MIYWTPSSLHYRMPYSPDLALAFASVLLSQELWSVRAFCHDVETYIRCALCMFCTSARAGFRTETLRRAGCQLSQCNTVCLSHTLNERSSTLVVWIKHVRMSLNLSSCPLGVLILAINTKSRLLLVSIISNHSLLVFFIGPGAGSADGSNLGVSACSNGSVYKPNGQSA